MRLSFEKVIEYMSTISFSDILFFCALLVLIALILILIYMLKKGNYYIEAKPVQKQETINETKEKDAPLDLKALTKALENATPKVVELTPYEEEQEEKAIISYDELVKAKKDFVLQYDEEQEEEGVLVKKVDLEQLSKDALNTLPPIETFEPKLEPTLETKESIVISYEKEEAFLEALKQLQKMLNE